MPSLSLTLDIVSLLLLAAISLAVPGVLLAGRGREGLYLRLWAIGGGLVALAILLIILRAELPGWLSILVANMAVTAGYGCLSVGTSLFSRRPRALVVDIGFGLFCAVVFVVAYVGDAALHVRIVINSLMLLGYSLMMIVNLRGCAPKSLTRSAQALFSAVIVVSLARIVMPAGIVEPMATLLSSFVLIAGVVVPLLVIILVLIIGLRRRAGVPFSPPTEAEQEAWRLSQARCVLCAPSGAELRLSGTEYLVLQQLAGSETTVPRATLNTLIGRDAENPKDRGIDILISRLRRKCSDAGVPLPVTSVRGQGYVFHGRLTLA